MGLVGDLPAFEGGVCHRARNPNLNSKFKVWALLGVIWPINGLLRPNGPGLAYLWPMAPKTLPNLANRLSVYYLSPTSLFRHMACGTQGVCNHVMCLAGLANQGEPGQAISITRSCLAPFRLNYCFGLVTIGYQIPSKMLLPIYGTGPCHIWI